MTASVMALRSRRSRTRHVAVAVSANPPAGMAATSIAALRATRPRQALDDAFHRVGPDTVAKILFTSGSTGDPKGVINTQRMLCSNQAAVRQVWRFLEDRPPVRAGLAAVEPHLRRQPQFQSRPVQWRHAVDR